MNENPWAAFLGGKVLYDGTVCDICGGLQVEFPTGVVVCPECETPAEVALRLELKRKKE